MIDFSPADGWLYQMHGGPEDGERYRINSGMSPDVVAPPRMQIIQYENDLSGVYVAELTDRHVRWGGGQFGVWRFVWVAADG